MENKRRTGPIVAVVIIIIAVAIGLAVVVLAGLPGGQPSLTAGPSALASAEPSSTPEPTLAIRCESAHKSAALTLRIEAIGETGRTWVISIYDDGRVLTPGITPNEPSDEAWMIVRFLTDGGVERLVDEVMDTGLFEASAQYSPVPLPGVEPPGRGASGYTITVGLGSEQVMVGWASLFDDDATYYEPSPEREQLDALAAHLIDFDSWLPAEEWASTEQCNYQAERFLVIVEAQAWGGSLDDLPVDIADVDWPLGGDALEWGEELELPDNDPGHIARCGEVNRKDADTLAVSLQSVGAEGSAGAGLDALHHIELRLGDRAETRIVSVYFEPLLPDECGCAGLYPPYALGI
ncbi:MAG: hypothetical protein WEE67_08095 [Chloroflexota bacterium]